MRFPKYTPQFISNTIERKFIRAVFAALIILAFDFYGLICIAGGENRNARIYFLNVGQGDSELIVFPTGARVLIDGGAPKGMALSDKWKKISVWTCPGGRCEDGETVETTLRREVAEETGITDLQILSYIGEVPGAKESDIVPLFFCTTEQEPRLMEPEKFSEWRWISKEDYFRGFPENFINSPARKLIVDFLRNT